MVMRLRLTSGMHLLEEWSVNACQADRNLVYKALFAVAEGSVSAAYDVIEAEGGPHRFQVLVKPGLVARIRLFRPDAFGIVHLGADEPEPESDPEPEARQQKEEA